MALEHSAGRCVPTGMALWACSTVLCLAQPPHETSAPEHSTHEHTTHDHLAPAPDSHRDHDSHTTHGAPTVHGHDASASAHESKSLGASAHIPPDPPQRVMGELSHRRMVELMGMDDAAAYSLVAVDRLEWRNADRGDALYWEAQAFYGNDDDKAWFRYEGSYHDSEYEASGEVLWDRLFSRWWSTQVGLRHDVARGPSRTWLGFGMQGLAPHWFEVTAMLYVGESARTAASLSAEHDVRLAQRWILQPALEITAYGKDDRDNALGAGLAKMELSLRLRYEIRREIAPYIGVSWRRLHGRTADWARLAGEDAEELQALAGLRMWF